MYPFKELQKHTFRFYAKNTYREIENGDVGNKLHIEDTPITSYTLLRAVPSNREPVGAIILTSSKFNAKIVVKKAIGNNISIRTNNSNEPLLKQFKTVSYKSQSAIYAKASIIGAYNLKHNITAMSILKAGPTVIFTPHNNILSNSVFSIHKTMFINYKKDKSINATTTIEKEFNLNIIMPSKKSYATEIMSDFYETTATFFNYDKAYTPFKEIEGRTFNELALINYANLSYRKVPLIERSVQLNG